MTSTWSKTWERKNKSNQKNNNNSITPITPTQSTTTSYQTSQLTTTPSQTSQSSITPYSTSESTLTSSNVLNNSTSFQENLLGPTYDYSSKIKMPSQIGMSSKGDLKTLGKNLTGLIEYVKALVSGDSNATKTKYLGNKFFLKTSAKCMAKDKNELVDRYVYMNNVPSGNIPFISDAMGVNFKIFKGLIPGVISNLNNFNPFDILSSFTEGTTPECQQITLQVIDNNNITSNESHYVTTLDLKNMDPCSFIEKVNPISKQKCRQAFTQMNKNLNPSYSLNIPDDYIISFLFFISLGFLFLFIIYKLMNKFN